MLNKIILTQIKTQNQLSVSAMLGDSFEEPKTYKSWIYPLRYLLALRYLKQKQKVLAWFRSQKIYPILDEDFKATLINQLSGKDDYSLQQSADKAPVSTFGFKALIFYPVLVGALIFGTFSLNDWYQQRRIENVLANHLPYYTDLIHQKLLLTHNQGNTSTLEKVNTSIAQEQEKIINDLPQKNGIRQLMNQQLETLKDPNSSSEEVMLGFKAINTLFDKKGLPYYLSPKSFSMPCSSLIDAPIEEMMMLKKLESLMSNNKPERCRTTMMTAYKVSKRNQLFYKNTTSTTNATSKKIELPLFQVKRIDKVPAVDSALGLTFKERGIGSIILTSRIENFGRESILPAMTFLGRTYVIPYWMQGYYEIEESITKGYKKDLNKIYPKKADRLKVKSVIKKLIKDKQRLQNTKLQQTLGRTNSNDSKSLFGNGFDAISVLLGKQNQESKKKAPKKLKLKKNDLDLLKRLDDVLIPSIEYHEAYHQIDKKDWGVPTWTQDLFKEEKFTDNGLDHTLEELGAYLAQIANTEQGDNIWLSKLLIFSISPFTKGQAEYYASSIILTTMDSLYLGKDLTPYFETSVEDKNRIYDQLISLSSHDKRLLANKAYEALFDRKVPKLSR